MKELVALAKARPGEIDYAAGAYGGNSHMAMEHLLMTAGIRMMYVPYKSGNAGLVDALSGRVPVMLSNSLVSLPHVRAGRFRPYGVTSRTRAAEMPDIPPIAEAGVPGYEAVQWFGILAPAGTPREIVGRLHRELVQIMQDEDMRKRFMADGADPVFSKTPEEFASVIRAELAKWAQVAQSGEDRASVEPAAREGCAGHDAREACPTPRPPPPGPVPRWSRSRSRFRPARGADRLSRPRHAPADRRRPPGARRSW